MNTFVKETLVSLRITLVFAVLLCGVFPLIIFGAGQLFFPRQANGSLIESRDRRILGSELLGQNFSGAKSFHPRPVPTVMTRQVQAHQILDPLLKN